MILVANLAVTKDGYIADINGGVDYLDKYNKSFDFSEFEKFLNSVDTVVMGYNAYSQVRKWGFPWKDKKRVIVFYDGKIKDSDVEVFSGSINDFIKNYNSVISKGFLFGGSNMLKQFLSIKYVDEFYFNEIPILLNDGIYLSTSNELESKYMMKLVSEEKRSGKNLNIFVKKFIK